MITSELINFGSKLLKKRGISSYQIDSEIILSHILKIPREKLLISEENVRNSDRKKFKSLIERRMHFEPIAYITNQKEFRSEDFFVNNNSLIPRPETELLLDPIVKIFKRRNLFFLDAGVGSGCIMVSILRELKHSRGIGIDLCKKAVENSKINLNKAKIYNRGQIFCRRIEHFLNRKFDLIVSNPPYILKRDINRLSDDVKKFEPIFALNGGNDGLDVIKKVIYKSQSILKLNGILALEIGTGQYLSVSRILKNNNYRELQIIKDYRNNVRCIFSTLLRKK